MNNRVESLKQLKADLLRSAELLALGEANTPLRKALDTVRPGMQFVVVFNWIPEQAEDIYWLLGDAEEVLMIELPRQGNRSGDMIFEAIDIRTFNKKKLTVETRRRLEVALELLNERNTSKKFFGS